MVRLLIIASALLVLFTFGSGYAQNYRPVVSVISNGAGSGSSGSYQLSGNFGESIIGEAGSSYIIESGFWYAVINRSVYFNRRLYDFGYAFLNQPSEPAKILLVNNSQSALNFTFALSGKDSSEFSFSPSSLQLEPYSSDTVTVQITALTEGIKNADLTFTTNSAVVADTVRFIAEAIIPTSILLIPKEVVFDTAGYNAPSTASVVLQNTGDRSADYRINFEGSGAAYFLTENTSGTVAAGDSADITVSFIPTVSGNITANMVFTGNFYPDTAFLTGTGVKDPTPPSISNVLISPVNPAPGDSLWVSAYILDDDEVDTVYLQYQKGSQQIFGNDIGMTGSFNTYRCIVPANAVTLEGLQLKIVAIDRQGNTNTYVKPVPLSLTGGGFGIGSTVGGAYPNGFPDNQWRMFSVPFVLDDNSVGAVLRNFGETGNSSWRLFERSTNVSNYATFPPGKAYWLKQILGSAQQIVLGSGRFADESDGVLTLQPGWNQIANPYPFPISWETQTSGAIDDSISGPIHWDGTKYVGPGQGDPTTRTELIPWDGYWVYNYAPSDKPLIISPSYDSTAITPAMQLRKSYFDEIAYVKIAVNSDTRSDEMNIAGFHKLASDGFDIFDLPELPVMGDYLTFSFAGREGDFTTDITAFDGSGVVKDAYCVGNIPGTVQLSMNTGALQSGLKAAIIDITNNAVITDDKTVYIFENRYPGTPVLFKVIIGTAGFVSENIAQWKAAMPDKYALHQNYPNPFNPATTIQYELPSQSQVSLEVYNILGERVRTLIDGEIHAAGKYTLHFDGKNQYGEQLTSGVYFYRMKADNFVNSKKMILLK